MKKLILVLFIAGIVTGTAFAQSISVSGTLELQQGMVAVVNNGAVYFVPHLARYIGFIDGLKESANIRLEGFIMSNRINDCLYVTKLDVSGKTYEFPVNNRLAGNRGGYRQRNFPGHRFGCCWY